MTSRGLRRAYEAWMAAPVGRESAKVFKHLEAVAKQRGYASTGALDAEDCLLFVRKTLGISLSPEAVGAKSRDTPK